MVNRPQALNSFEFIAVAALRTAQLMRGCVPRVPAGHKPTTTAQLEILAGKVFKTPLVAPVSDAAVPPVRDAQGAQEAIPPVSGERS
jgi:DNA-directed RNA polymerase subunit K/omega